MGLKNPPLLWRSNASSGHCKSQFGETQSGREHKSGAACSYSRFAALSRAVVWLKKDAMAILRVYGIAPSSDSGGVASGMPYLPGFENEKMFLKSVR